MSMAEYSIIPARRGRGLPVLSSESTDDRHRSGRPADGSTGSSAQRYYSRSMKPVSFLILLVLLCAAVPAVSAAETYVVTATWGTNGSGDGQLHYPEDIALDAAGNVYVTDGGNHRFQKYTVDGTFVWAIGEETTWASEAGTFSEPTGIAVDREGFVYVTDTGRFRVLKFASDGTFISEWGTEGSGDGQIYSPSDIAVDGEGYVYVPDILYSGIGPRIQKFTSNGQFVTKWMTFGNAVTYSQPMGIAADSAGHVYVVDLRKNLVQKYTSTGTLLAEWGTEGSGDGQFNLPMGIAVDGAGFVYVTEPYANRVQKFTSDGTFVTKWGTDGTGAGEFSHPSGIAVDDAGSVYVVDALQPPGPEVRGGSGAGSDADGDPDTDIHPDAAGVDLHAADDDVATTPDTDRDGDDRRHRRVRRRAGPERGRNVRGPERQRPDGLRRRRPLLQPDEPDRRERAGGRVRLQRQRPDRLRRRRLALQPPLSDGSSSPFFFELSPARAARRHRAARVRRRALARRGPEAVPGSGLPDGRQPDRDRHGPAEDLVEVHPPSRGSVDLGGLTVERCPPAPAMGEAGYPGRPTRLGPARGRPRGRPVVLRGGHRLLRCPGRPDRR